MTKGLSRWRFGQQFLGLVTLCAVAACGTPSSASDTDAAAATDGGATDDASTSADAAPLPMTVTMAVAPVGYKTTADQAQKWKDQFAADEDFVDMQVRAEVVVASRAASNSAQVAGDKLTFPLAGNEALLQLKPGAPFVGRAADPDAYAAGKSNNVLGFLRKVKSVQQVGDTIELQTGKAHLEEVFIGAMSMHFPKTFEELDIGKDVDLPALLPDTPTRVVEAIASAPQAGTMQGLGAWQTQAFALSQDVDFFLGYSFGKDEKVEIDKITRPIKFGDVEMEIDGTGLLEAAASLQVGAFLKISIEETWSDPLPHLAYFFGGVGGLAKLGFQADLDIELTVKTEVSKEPEEAALEHVAKNPEKSKMDHFQIGKPKYYNGPTIFEIPTRFALVLEASCEFELHGKLKASANAWLQYDATYGLEFKDDKWSIHKPGGLEKRNDFTITDVGGGAQVTCTIGPKLSWLFADVGGPSFGVRAGGKAYAEYESVCPPKGSNGKDLDATGQITLGLDVGVVASIGLTVDLFFWSDEWSWDVWEHWWTIWSNTWDAPSWGKCPTDCNNGMMDDMETAPDCGGKSEGGGCLPCDIHAACKGNEDCQTGLQCSGGFCGFVQCATGKQEAWQSDVNCGGLCSTAGHRCDVGKKCVVDGDCKSVHCSGGLCVPPPCDNGALDGKWESDVDCGGECVEKCGAFQHCWNDTSCNADASCINFGNTYYPDWRCVPKACDALSYTNTPNFTKVGDMTDYRCGGTCARMFKGGLPPSLCRFDAKTQKALCGNDLFKCADDEKCAEDKDCVSGFCLEGVCSELQCADGEKEPYEADADCGGKCPQPCGLNKACGSDADCADGLLCASSLAGYSVCVPCIKDGKVNGQESDVDCGGVCGPTMIPLPRCGLGKKCKSSNDCESPYGFTNAQGAWQVAQDIACVGGVCTDPCSDGKLTSGYEADIDCGGKCPTKCAPGLACASGSDCDSGSCLAGKCATACLNGKQDAAEGSVDCGGPCALKCVLNQGCKVDGDCVTGFCKAGVCGIDTCKDGAISGGESDIDCGGPCKTQCALNQKCKLPSDCATGACDGSKCVASACQDLRKDGSETDADCGGTCIGCAVGKYCLTGGDCASGVCSAAGKCAATTCTDGKFTVANETDVDCGKACAAKCTLGKGCKSGADCDSGYCNGTVCVADQCSDKVLSAGETDLDCGGVCQAKKCASGWKCKSGGDCASGVCASNGTCVLNACQDGNKSAGESGVDCGGVCSVQCLNGQGCAGGIDCVSGFCAAKSALCVATACADQIQDAGEVDIDCGGPCQKCASGQKCTSGSDCDSGFCNGTVCVGGACEDKKLSPGETDIDCGGPCLQKCALKSGCAQDSDCDSGHCDGAVCVASACLDKRKDSGEGDIDCGSVCGVPCQTGLGCTMDADCASGVCSVGNKCVATTCEDGKISGGESDVDCGAVCGVKCPSGELCSTSADCASTYCDGTKCVADHCADKQKDAGETGSDCGGTCAATCAVGDSCLAGTDCASGVCTVNSLKCVATTCEDEAKDQSESDVDCGGSCTPCATSKKCAIAGDCASNLCAAKSLVCVDNTCKDEVQDGDETAVDCGNVTCGGCANGVACTANDQCLSQVCSGAAGSQTCGCPAFTVSIPVNHGGVTTIACASASGGGGGAQDFPSGLFVDAPIDASNHLQWALRGAIANAGPMSWSSAFAYCDNLVYAGFDDWRMATASELMSTLTWGVSDLGLPSEQYYLTSQIYKRFNANGIVESDLLNFQNVWAYDSTYFLDGNKPSSPPKHFYMNFGFYPGSLSPPPTWANFRANQYDDPAYPACVRSLAPAKTVSGPRYVYDQNNTVVRDLLGGATWALTAPQTTDLATARAYCKNLSIPSVFGWFVPSAQTAMSTLDFTLPANYYGAMNMPGAQWDTTVFGDPRKNTAAFLYAVAPTELSVSTMSLIAFLPGGFAEGNMLDGSQHLRCAHP